MQPPKSRQTFAGFKTQREKGWEKRLVTDEETPLTENTRSVPSEYQNGTESI
jgi:hypothetical protein